MPVTVHIPSEVIEAEGFIRADDIDRLIKAIVENDERLHRITIPLIQVAAYLGVGKGRMYWYQRHKGLPDRMTLAEVWLTDWSEITDKDRSGDNKRKRTYIKF